MFLTRQVLGKTQQLKLSQVFTCQSKAFRRPASLVATQSCYFSSDAEPKAAEESKETAANASEWGIKYDDECLKFEKEWKAISEAVEKDQMVYLTAELSD